MDQQQFEERMEEALKEPFPKEHWPESFRILLGRALDHASPFSLSIKAAAFARVAAFAEGETEEISLSDAAASLNCIEAASPENLTVTLSSAVKIFTDVEASAKVWNEIVEPIKKKAFAEIAAQAKLQQNTPKGKQVRLAAGKKK
jgi:hypothetical protein